MKSDANNKTDQIYLDYCATTPVDPDVIEAMKPFFSEMFGNASSIHMFGRQTKIALEESRESIARCIGAEPGEIFFTSGGTEADNHALVGTALAARRTNGKDHIIISAIEHHAVLFCADYLRELGFRVSVVPVDGDGRIDPASVEREITSGTCVVSVMHANNEIGTIQPVREIAAIAHAHDAVFHSDTVQSIGKISVDVTMLDIDLLSISAHKIYGPKGIGAIYIRKGADVDSFIHGGAQERNRRAGTENVPLAVGFARAMTNSAKNLNDETIHLKHLQAVMREMLADRFEGIIFNGDWNNMLPNIVNISFDSSKVDIDGEALLLNMDLQGVAVTSGSACSSGSMEPSHVLLALGRDVKTAKASIRFSFGKHTTEEEILRGVQVLDAAVKQSTMVHA
jgi:cysteine desulfurase